MLEEEIAVLEQKLKLYSALLELLEACSDTNVLKTRIREDMEVVEYVDSSGSTGLALRIGGGRAEVFFMINLLDKNPYFKYLIHVLRKLSEQNTNLKYRVGANEGQVKTVIIHGLSKEDEEELRTTIDYVARKLGLQPAKQEEQDEE